MSRLIVFIFLSACSGDIRGVLTHCKSDGTCPVGTACDPGTVTCVTATGASCSAAGEKESCSRSQGACTAGQRTCVRGAWSACSGVMPTAEICDGTDNDCDGKTDEDFPALGTPCIAGTGACATSGVQQCGGVCSAKPLAPSAEACDGIDNDCDGIVDNHIASGPACPLTRGVCASSHAPCVAGAFASCDATSYGPSYDPAPAETLCDGLDNNCDGQVDEGYVFKSADLTLSELVPCPQQIWCDANIAACGKSAGEALAGGANGIAFDSWPGTDALGANLADNAWLEVQNHLACPVALAAITFSIGSPGIARASDGSACTNIPANGFCVVQMPALLGPDSTTFSQTVSMSMAGQVIDSVTYTVTNGCNPGCRNSTRSQTCCENEALARTDTGVIAHPATPLRGDAALTAFFPAQRGSVQFTETLALDAQMADANGDGDIISAGADDFIELEAVRDLSLGSLTLTASKGASATEHVFSCFAPLAAGERVAIFGGGSAVPAHAIVSSVGSAAFDLPRDTALQFSLGAVGSVDFPASAFTGGAAGSRESQQLCNESFESACECACTGRVASCVVDCDNTCDSTPPTGACFSPGI